MGHKSYCTIEVEGRSVERTSSKPHWNCLYEDASKKLCMVAKVIEKMVKSCIPCQETKNAPAVAPLHPWIWPMRPWQRIHIDFAGPMNGQSFLIVVDLHSKWPEVIEMKSTTATATIKELRRLCNVWPIGTVSVRQWTSIHLYRIC